MGKKIMININNNRSKLQMNIISMLIAGFLCCQGMAAFSQSNGENDTTKYLNIPCKVVGWDSLQKKTMIVCASTDTLYVPIVSFDTSFFDHQGAAKDFMKACSSKPREEIRGRVYYIPIVIDENYHPYLFCESQDIVVQHFPLLKKRLLEFEYRNYFKFELETRRLLYLVVDNMTILDIKIQMADSASTTD